MKAVIKTAERPSDVHGVAFNFDDMTERAKAYLAGVQSDAARIIADAQKQAESLRQQAQRDGQAAALADMQRMVEQQVGQQMQTLLPALKKAIAEIEQAKHDWLQEWEQRAIHVAAAMARRVIRRELSVQPEINLTFIREALELAAGNPEIRILLNPEDQQVLGRQAKLLVDELVQSGTAEIVASAEISPGGCRVETQFGEIDQQIETQLARLEEELT